MANTPVESRIHVSACISRFDSQLAERLLRTMRVRRVRVVGALDRGGAREPELMRERGPGGARRAERLGLARLLVSCVLATI
jgi:hypothetical protein